MSNSNSIETISVNSLKVSELKFVASTLKLAGRSKWNKQELIDHIQASFVMEVEEDTLNPVFLKVDKVKFRNVIKKLSDAFDVMMRIASECGIDSAKEIVNEVSEHMRNGVKLFQLVENPQNYGVSLHWVVPMIKFASLNDARKISVPTREGVMAVEAVVSNGVVDSVIGKVRVKGNLVRQSQSALFDVVSKERATFVKQPNGSYVRVPSSPMLKPLIDGTNIVFVDFNMDIPEGQEELTEEQKQLQFVAMNGGIIVEVEGREIVAEYLYQTPSQQRLVQATFVAEMDAIEVLQKLGHDFRVYAKNKDGVWTIDMSKAIKRFGLSGTNTIASSLIKIGNEIEKLDNGDALIVGGTHTMRITKGAHAFVKTGEYKVYDIENKTFRTVDAKEHARLLAAGDGQVFCDETVYNALVAEFGLDTSAWQIRITPFTKGLMIFVPGLKEIYGADIVAFDTAVKGNYETLLINDPAFKIEVRIALFNKPASMAKKYTTIPYQFLNTLPLGPSAYIEIADKHLDRAFELYEDPKLMSEYLGLNVLSELEKLSDEDLSEDQREFAKNTLVSNFTEFLYSGDFTMKDPMMKKYAKDIIENVIKQWTYGSIPVEGHYRFMVQDPYAILEAKCAFDRLESKGVKDHDYKFIDEDGEEFIIVPSYIGLPANSVFMVDDNDEFMMEGNEVVFNRNPKIAYGETAIATTFITEAYANAHAKFKKAFVNLAVFSVHDFNTFKQGGADNDGDTTFSITEKSIVDAVSASISRFPALLDISVDVNGNFIEGCPFSNPNMDKNEFKRSFTDEEYANGVARELHELSKVYVLRTLEPNDIGKLTNFATKILDAVTKLTISINNNLTVDGSPLSDADKKTYLVEIKRYLHYTDVLRMVQGWEIDKAKHGGYYKLFMDLSFINDEANYPFFATKLSKDGNHRVWFTPDWMSARKGISGEKTCSLIQSIRNHVVARFEKDIVEKFNTIDPVTSDLSVELALAIQKPNHYDDVLKAVRLVKSEYNKGLLNAIEYRDTYLDKLSSFTTFGDGRTATEAEKVRCANNIISKFEDMMSAVRETANARMSALEIELNVHPAVLGLAAYEITYDGKIERNIKEGKESTSGLSFVWAGAKYQFLSAVRLVSGKDMRFTNVEKVNASGVKVNIGSLKVDPAWIKENALAKGKIYVWNKPVTDETDPLFGYHVFSAYVGPVEIGYVFANKAHAFAGHDKWEVNISDVTYKVNEKTKTVRSMTFTLDEVTPFVKH